MAGSDITGPRLNCLEEEVFDDHTNLDSGAVFKSTHHRTKLLGYKPQSGHSLPS